MNRVQDKQIKYEKALEYEIFVKGEYSFAGKEIKKAECIFDIWWHKWFFSQWCRTLNSKAKIHYFEPIWEFYNQARQKLWGDDNIVLNNYWVGSKSGKWVLLLNQEKTMQSSKYLSFLNPEWTEIWVDFITLKEYLQQNHTDKIDVLKMDIEWMEFEVLSSWTDFEWNRISSLIMEIHLLNEEMKSEWNQIFIKIKNIFWNVEIIKSEYCDEIFLVWAK